MPIELTPIQAAEPIGLVLNDYIQFCPEVWGRQVRASYRKLFKGVDILQYQPIRTTALVVSAITVAFIAIQFAAG